MKSRDNQAAATNEIEFILRKPYFFLEVGFFILNKACKERGMIEDV
jgi:hypothetical protein